MLPSYSELIWWTNGTEEVKAIESPGENWKIGRKNRCKAPYWNNGEISIRSIDCPGEGWKRGRMLKKLTWWTNDKDNVCSEDCPHGWKRGRTIEQTGKHWWNDGNKNVKSIECPGKNWKLGLLTKESSWWTNGIINKKSNECPGEGWIRGMHSLTHKRKKHIVSEKTKQKMKRVHKGHEDYTTEDGIEKMRKAKIGNKLWNNGEIYIHAKSCPGDGWVNGRIKNNNKIKGNIKL